LKELISDALSSFVSVRLVLSTVTVVTGLAGEAVLDRVRVAIRFLFWALIALY
jgi:hypothetical protein